MLAVACWVEEVLEVCMGVSPETLTETGRQPVAMLPGAAIPMGGAGGAMGQGRVLGDGDLGTVGILGGPLGSGGLLSGLLSTVQGLTG